MIYGFILIVMVLSKWLNNKIHLLEDIDIQQIFIKDFYSFLEEWIKIKNVLMIYKDLIFKLQYGVE